MKRSILVSLAAMMLLFSGCYKDDIDDLQSQIDKLNTEQQAQAEKIKQYQTLLDALNKKLTVTKVETTDNGSKVIFSDGTFIEVKNGTNGTDGENGTNGANAPAIMSVTELNGQVIFNMSDGTTIEVHKVATVALYVLSEGDWNQSGGDLAYIDLLTGVVTPKYFSAQNGLSLGEVSNDLKLYGSRMYCAVSGSDKATGGHIEVIDPKTGKSLKRIPATDKDGKPDQPRNIALANGKVYVTMYSGSVASIDTTILEISGRAILSGTYTEGICVYNGKLYACNSGWGTGTTISVIDIATFSETAVITVPQNPMSIMATTTGDIYFTTADYTWGGGNPSDLHRFNVLHTGNIKTFGIRASRMTIGTDYVYTIDPYETYPDAYIKKIHLKTGTVANFITDNTTVQNGHNINLNPANGDVYFTSQGKYIYGYHQDGTKINTFETGVNYGSSIVFINK